MNRYDFYIGDYLRDTSDLSMAEDGAYVRLLNWYYANERPIEDRRKFSVARAVTEEEQEITQWVLSRFFICRKKDGVDIWVHKRCNLEIAKAVPRIKAAKENGKKGGRPKKETQKKPSGFSNGLPTGIPSGVPSRESSPSPSPSDNISIGRSNIYTNRTTSRDQIEETSKVDLQPLDEALEFLPKLEDRNIARFILTVWSDCTTADAIAWVQQAKPYLLQLDGDPMRWIEDISTSKSPNDPVYDINGRNRLHQWLMNCLKNTVKKQKQAASKTGGKVEQQLEKLGRLRNERIRREAEAHGDHGHRGEDVRENDGVIPGTDRVF
jgi:uncharacterized protein YdaU (DUF1376 family)